MKKLILTGISLFIIGAAQAQDRDNQEYKDGMDDGVDVTRVLHSTNCIAARNVIAISPFQFTENGVGVGLSYERSLDEAGYISLYVPIMATFKNRSDFNYYYYGNGANNNMYYAMPGVKFYPTRMGKVKYAIGPSAVIAFGHKDNYLPKMYDPYVTNYYNGGYVTYPYPYYNYNFGTDRFLLGMMLNNSLNFNPTPHFYAGIEFGFGFTFIDRVGGYETGTKGLAQGAFKVGYRF